MSSEHYKKISIHLAWIYQRNKAPKLTNMTDKEHQTVKGLAPATPPSNSIKQIG